MSKKFLTRAFMLLSLTSFAQQPAGPEMADAMRSNGKIYIVISVIGIIFLALVSFLVYLERRVKKLEEENRK